MLDKLAEVYKRRRKGHRNYTKSCQMGAISPGLRGLAGLFRTWPGGEARRSLKAFRVGKKQRGHRKKWGRVRPGIGYISQRVQSDPQTRRGQATTG